MLHSLKLHSMAFPFAYTRFNMLFSFDCFCFGARIYFDSIVWVAASVIAYDNTPHTSIWIFNFIYSFIFSLRKMEEKIERINSWIFLPFMRSFFFQRQSRCGIPAPLCFHEMCFFLPNVLVITHSNCQLKSSKVLSHSREIQWGITHGNK